MARPLVDDLLPSSFIYGGRGHPKTHQLFSRVRCPPPLFTPPVILLWCLGEALRGSLHQRCHHAVVLTELIYSFIPLLDQEFEGRHRDERVQNSEVPYVRYLIG